MNTLKKLQQKTLLKSPLLIDQSIIKYSQKHERIELKNAMTFLGFSVAMVMIILNINIFAPISPTQNFAKIDHEFIEYYEDIELMAAMGSMSLETINEL